MSSCGKRVFLPLALVFLVAFSAFAGEAGLVVRENGVLENTQVALLLLSGIIFAVQSFAVARNISGIFWMGAWFCLSCILRELDVEDLAVPQWVVLIGSGMGRNLIMGLGWGVLGVLAIRDYLGLKGLFGRLARSRTALFMLAAGVLLLLGSLFDHETVEVAQGKAWEETFETLAYFLVLSASLFSRSIFGEQEPLLEGSMQG